MIRRMGIILGLLAYSVAAHAQEITIELRGGRTVKASFVEPTLSMLRCTVEQSTRQYGWHEIAGVVGPGAELVQPFLIDAEHAWRGLSRLDRGDRVAAEPALERAYLHFGESRGPTAFAVSQGLLDCRIARGAQALAVETYLTFALNMPVTDESELLDPATRLCPSLPPIWGTDSGLSAMVSRVSVDSFAAWEDSQRVRQIAELYTTAALFELGGAAPASEFTPADEGVRFLQQIVNARVGDQGERERARDRLRSRLGNGLPDWQKAWIHAAIGLSLLAEQDERLERLGIVQMLIVPAQYAEAQPYLAGVCMSQAAMQLSRLRRQDAAERLILEFASDYSTHSAIETPGVRQLIQQAHDSISQRTTRKDDA